MKGHRPAKAAFSRHSGRVVQSECRPLQTFRARSSFDHLGETRMSMKRTRRDSRANPHLHFDLGVVPARGEHARVSRVP